MNDCDYCDDHDDEEYDGCEDDLTDDDDGGHDRSDLPTHGAGRRIMLRPGSIKSNTVPLSRPIPSSSSSSSR